MAPNIQRMKLPNAKGIVEGREKRLGIILFMWFLSELNISHCFRFGCIDGVFIIQ